MSWSGRRVLVTGAAGFLGSHLCERLAGRGAEVTAFVRYGSRADAGNLELVPKELRDSLRVVRGNVEDAALVEAAVAGQEVVFHLAALIGIPYSYEAPRSYVRTNVDGTLHVLEAARRHGTARVVVTSTSEVYGTALRVPMDEGHPLRAHSPYAATKIAADALAEAFGRSFGVPVSVIRPFNAYGPRQSARAVVPAIVSQALLGPEVRLGATDPVRDLTFVSDLVDAFLLVAESAGTVGRVVNAGSGTGISVGALAREVLSLLGVERPIVQDPERLRPAGSEVERLVCDARLLRDLTGWAPVTPLREGLAAVIRFVSENQGLYRPERYAT